MHILSIVAVFQELTIMTPHIRINQGTQKNTKGANKMHVYVRYK